MNSQISKTVGADGEGAVRLQGLVRKPRHKWFAHTSREAENGWSGPHDHIEDAARATLLAWEAEGDTCYIAQGRKLTKTEYEEQGAEYTWEVDMLNAMKLVLPNVSDRRPGERHANEKLKNAGPRTPDVRES